MDMDMIAVGVTVHVRLLTGILRRWIVLMDWVVWGTESPPVRARIMNINDAVEDTNPPEFSMFYDNRVRVRDYFANRI